MSLLIAHGADVNTVQARLRHGSAKTTLDTYGHPWLDKDESTKVVIEPSWTQSSGILRTLRGPRRTKADAA